jgi:hypothetical protein
MISAGSRVRQILTPLLLSCFVLGVLVPRTPQNCTSMAGHASADRPDGTTHKSSHHSSTPSDTHCITHACCFTAVSGPATIEQSAPAMWIGILHFLAGQPVAPAPAFPHLLPYANAPPTFQL